MDAPLQLVSVVQSLYLVFSSCSLGFGCRHIKIIVAIP